MSGEDIATDKQKCQLKPLQGSDYYPVQFSEEQWAALQRTWPTGVCDFSKPGVSQTGTVPWRTYENDSGGGAVIMEAGRWAKRLPARAKAGRARRLRAG
jgi:hypothetical protein